MASPLKSIVAVTTGLIALLLKIAWVASMVVVPVLGMWLSSSLAAYHNRSIGWCIAFGLLLFPVLPVLWDRIYIWRDSKKSPERKRILTALDRQVLRTLLLNLGFIVAIMAIAPSSAFRALSSRGDWALDGHSGPIATAARRHLFQVADLLEGQWKQASERYGKSDAAPVPQDDTDSTQDTSKAQELEKDIPAKLATKHWPLAPEIHTAVSSMADTAQNSYQDAAQYLLQRFPDPFERSRAIHDFIVLRLQYDYDLLAAYDANDRSNYVPQDAASVFSSRTAVCEGYARLMQAMGTEAGLEVAYIVGNARFLTKDTDGSLHAWNAVKIEAKWYLMDVTWDDGSEAKKQPPYKTTYLNTPPEIFGVDHFPEDPAWQLRTPPLSLGEFMRQPDLRPDFALYDLQLISPTRSQVTVSGSLEMQIGNPRGVSMLATYRRKDSSRDSEGSKCAITDGELITVRCDFPSDGEYLVTLFANSEKYGSYAGVAHQLVNSQ